MNYSQSILYESAELAIAQTVLDSSGMNCTYFSGNCGYPQTPVATQNLRLAVPCMLWLGVWASASPQEGTRHRSDLVEYIKRSGHAGQVMNGVVVLLGGLKPPRSFVILCRHKVSGISEPMARKTVAVTENLYNIIISLTFSFPLCYSGDKYLK